MLRVDWVHEDYEGKTNVGFQELIIALANVTDEELFSYELVTTLIDYIWDEYSRTIYRRCLVPFIFYFVVMLIYLSRDALVEYDVDQDFTEKNFVIRVTAFALATYRLYLELLGLK